MRVIITLVLATAYLVWCVCSGAYVRNHGGGTEAIVPLVMFNMLLGYLVFVKFLRL